MRNFKQSHLRSFVKVAELGSITVAAQHLHRSPSAVSMTVANLESQLGRRLFESDGKARLTPFGQYVYEVSIEQLKRYDYLVSGIQAYAKNDFGRVDIAAVPSFATHFLPGLLIEFINHYPNITLSIRDSSSVQIYKMIEQGDVDIGIVSPKTDAIGIDFLSLFTDQIGVVCSRKHKLNRFQRPLAWSDIKDFSFIANGTCDLITANEFRSILNASEIEVQNTTSLLALIAAGVGITTLPKLAVPENRRDIVFLPTRYRQLKREIGIITPTNRTLSPAALAFFDTAEKNLVSH